MEKNICLLNFNILIDENDVKYYLEFYTGDDADSIIKSKPKNINDKEEIKKIFKLLEIDDTDQISDLPCRVKLSEDMLILSIGHFIKNNWVDL